MPRELTPQEESNRDFNQSQSEVGSPLKTLKGTPIKRYKNLVGKEVAGQVYLHKNYVETLLTSGKYHDRMISIANYEEALEHIGDTPFNCVMLDHKKRRIRFDEAPDFDTAREPIAGNMTYYDIPSRSIIMTDYSGQIWHHKWMWVMNDYTGFDVRESWEWSKTYLSVLRDTGDPEANRGIANGMGQGGKLWRAQLRYFGLEEATSVANTIVSSVSYIKEYIRDSVRENEINQFDADFLDVIIDGCEAIYKDYNAGEISDQELEQRAKDHAKEIIFQYGKESGKTKGYLQDILENFDQDLLDVSIDLGTDISAMTIKEAEEPMDGNRPFDQALELMDKFDYALMDYDEGAMSKETISQKFSTLQYKVEQLKKGCGIEDRTFLNEKMKQFKEILNYYKIPLEECNEDTVYYGTGLPDDSYKRSATQDPETTHPYVGRKVRNTSTGRAYTVTRAYDDPRGTHVRSDIGNTTITMKDGEYTLIPQKKRTEESKKITEAETHQYLVRDISVEGDEIHLSCYDRKYDEDFDKYLVTCQKSIRLLMRDPAFDLTDEVKQKCKELLPTLKENKKITESSQSPMIFKVGNVYKLTPNESYAYDRVEILGIAWNDMVGQCTIQYKVVMKDGSVEEGQSEAGDLISTIKKNNEDRVEFYRTEVPKMNEAVDFSEEYLWDTLHPAISDALIQVTGNGLDDASYNYNDGELRGQGIVYLSKKVNINKIWKSIDKAMKDALRSLDYENFSIYDREVEPMDGEAPFKAYRIYFEAEALISTVKENNEDQVEFYRTEDPKMNESETLTEAASDITFMIVDAIEGTIKECIDSGEGHYSRDDLSVTAAWADDEDSIDIVIRSEGRSIHYIEPGVASRMGW